jgi:hypothetical protein
MGCFAMRTSPEADAGALRASELYALSYIRESEQEDHLRQGHRI